MIEQTLDIVTTDGAMETFIVHPDHGAWPPVLMLMDAPGMTATASTALAAIPHACRTAVSHALRPAIGDQSTNRTLRFP